MVFSNVVTLIFYAVCCPMYFHFSAINTPKLYYNLQSEISRVGFLLLYFTKLLACTVFRLCHAVYCVNIM